MARPKTPELTERELEIMHVFWDEGPKTAQMVRDELAARGRDLTYTTVATLVRILADKGFVRQVNEERPFVYEPVRGFEEVSQSLVNHFVSRVFGGARDKLLVSLFGRQKLTKKEIALLAEILKGQER
jgi:predicted transcriptional regulator